MTSVLSILAKSSGAVDQNLAVDKGNNGDVLISTTTGFSFVAANTLTPNLSQVLFVGNTATNDINLTGNITANTFIGNLSGTATTANTAINLEGGAGGSIPYQSAANTTAFLVNGNAGQVLTSAGGTNAPTWSSAPENTDGNWQFDDMWGGQSTNNGPFGMIQVGTAAANSPQSQNAADGYNGIQRIWNTATNTSVGYQSGSTTWFRNMLSNSKGFVMIFRPWPLGTATNTTLYVGFSNDFSAGAPANQLAWQFSTNQAPTNVWSFRQDGASVYNSGYATTGANQWHRMTLVRTGASTYTTTLQNLDIPSAIYSYNGTCSATNLNLCMGGLVACVSGAASKYLDIDYIGNYFNSVH